MCRELHDPFMPESDMTRNQNRSRSITFLSTGLSTTEDCKTVPEITSGLEFRPRFVRKMASNAALVDNNGV